MYAQLCKRLSEETPNFDDPSGPCTFNRLLLSKCQDEFERRWRANEEWDNPDDVILTQEEEEQKSAARRKMVGNLRFIGELGKLEIINESILHRCVRQLLEKRRRSKADMAEDLECLCQIMRTCGKVLDKPKAKNLMTQYFERMQSLRSNQELPSRIRFMLQDVIELRDARWVPRKGAQSDGPRTIQQVREEAARELGVYIPPPSHHNNPRSSGPISPIAGLPLFFPHTGNGRTGMEDVFSAPPMGAVTLGTGPGVISSQPDKFSYDNDGYMSNNTGRDNNYRSRQQGNYTQNNYYQNRHFNNQSYNRQQQNNQFNQQQSYNNGTNKDMAPRFKKLYPLSNNGEISLRPSTMSLKPKTPGMLPQSALDSTNHNDGPNSSLPLVNQPQAPNQKPTPPLLHKEPPILIKQVSLEKPKYNKKEKANSRESQINKASAVLRQALDDHSDKTDFVLSYRNCKIPERLAGDIVYQYFLTLLKEDTSKRTLGTELLCCLNERDINTTKMVDALRKILNQIETLQKEQPECKEHLAKMISTMTLNKCFPLSQIIDLMDGGDYFPLVFMVLECLSREMGKSELIQEFQSSKIQLLNLIPDNERSKDKLAEVLEDKNLTFLSPLLRIQQDLWNSLQKDSSPHAFYKNIKDTIDVEHHTSPGFINELVTVLIKYISMETTLANGIDPKVVPEKAVMEQEKELLSRFKPVLQTFLHEQANLQLIAIYALQVYTHTKDFPKGMLLRWFMNFYELDIIEEEAFVAWKEDLSDYPGKGQALFQVNNWLMWLQETEEDEEEEEDAED